MTYAGAATGAGAFPNLDVLAHNAYRSAKADLRAAIGLLNGGQLTVQQWATINYYFMLAPNNAVLPQGLAAMLQATLDGIKNNQITIRIEFFNYVNSTPGLIRIARAQALNVNQFVRFFIHEATHLYAQTVDHGERGYTNNQGQYRQPGLTAPEALVNADTYAHVAVLLAGRALV